jgi:IS30 family transposase
VAYLFEQIVRKGFSPDVIAAKMRSRGLDFAVCTKTIYNLIERGCVEGVSNESLWEKRKRKGKRRFLRRERKRALPPGKGIQHRPPEADDRSETGHWEIDLVCSGTSTKDSSVLLTLVERKTRKTIIRKLRNKSQHAVLRALNGIERQMGREAFRRCFKSITADNGSEFLDYRRMEESVFGGRRTRIYYTHPYSSWERGSNENLNRMIRRFIPKGSSIARYSRQAIGEIESWINNYPRKLLNYMSAAELFRQEIEA